MVVLVLAMAPSFVAFAAESGWSITTFDARVDIQSDGRVLVNETLEVDFTSVQRHGIFRDIPVRYDWTQNPRKIRVYELQVLSVTDAQGRAWRYETSSNGANVEIKIGDPNRLLTGHQTYRISYIVRGALNGFSDHDELFWNVTGGEWPVPILHSAATVHAPAALTQTACFAGPPGARAGCSVTNEPQGALFSSGPALQPGDQLTLVAGLRKGVVPDPRPILQDRPRDAAQLFDLSPLWLALAVFVAIAGLALVFWRWWTVGRDDPDRVTIVPEYEPPDKLRPAQIGVLIDERADTLDVTATIVDLAVRGYLTISEIPKQGLFGSRDWLITRKDGGDEAALLPYERTIRLGLFDKGTEVKLSSLKRHFYLTLASAEHQLYADAVQHGWFPADPSRVRATYAVLGIAFIILAGVVAFGLGTLAGGGIVGVAGAIPAIALVAFSPVMPRKTKGGAELARRSFGFRRYMQVAETDRQRFAEKEHIFADYLPYAIVYLCVDQWAKAFEGIDLKEATSGCYAGTNVNVFTASALSQDLASFSSQVSTAIASTPGGSGSSGFGGGAGGGGGGGGGGSW